VDVLLIISRALDQNGLTYCTLLSHKAQSNLNRFKREPGVMCLLIPVQSGANGLNLIEATHVLLVEPILNPGSELQAIGRVHRIGQTKPTVVHRSVNINFTSISFILYTNLQIFSAQHSGREDGADVGQTPVDDIVSKRWQYPGKSGYLGRFESAFRGANLTD
jgi:Helicase conserved C-terminal domain